MIASALVLFVSIIFLIWFKNLTSFCFLLFNSFLFSKPCFDISNKSLAFYLSEITLDPNLPTPIGILYKEDKPTYDEMVNDQVTQAIKDKGEGDLDALLHMGQTWEVSE